MCERSCTEVKSIDTYQSDKDISAYQGHWAYSKINSAIKSGLLGSVNLATDVSMTQRDAALLLFRHLNIKLLPAETGVAPLTADEEIYAAVMAAGLFGGVTGDKIEPERIVSRIDFLTLAQNAGLFEKSETPVSDFTDIFGLSPEQQQIVSGALAERRISSSKSFRPLDGITIGEALTVLQGNVGSGAAATNNVLFTDNESLLRNPYTGIFSYNVDNGPHGYDIRFSPDNTYTSMPEVSHVYMRLAWSYFQPEEDIFDFSMIDSMIERCKQQDMQVALRITSAESGMEYATPKWVFDKGAVAHRWTWGNPNWVSSGGNVAPDWNDPIYLEYVEKFVKEFAKRYDGNENIAYIDVGMLGIWGEMHMNMGVTIETIGPEDARKIFDIWRKYFTNTDLFILNNETFYPQLEDYAIQNNLFWRNDYLYIDSWGQGDAHVFAETEKRWQNSPVNGELMHWASQIEGKIDGNGIIQSGSKAGQSAVDAIITPYHLTYLGLHGYTKDIKERYAGYLESVAKKIGYRILPTSVAFPAEANAHDTILVNVNWKNVGVAPCYHGAYPALTLKNENGTIMSVMVDTEFNVKDLPALSDNIVEDVAQEVQFKLGATLPGGNYKVYLSLGNAAGDPKIKMPIDGNDGENRYYIGDMKIRGDYSASAMLAEDGLNVTITPYPDIPKGTEPYTIGDVYLAMYDVAKGGRRKPEADHYGDKEIMLNGDEVKQLVKDAFDTGEARSAIFSPSRLGADEDSFAGKSFEVYFYPMHYGSKGPNYFHLVSNNGFYAYLGVLSFDESNKMSFVPAESP